MSPRPDVSKARTKQILDAAINVFSRLGFHKASMDDIVEEAGLSKGALYWYFKSKDDIIVGILGYLFGRELAEMKALPTAPGTATERLDKFIQLSIEEIRGMTRLMPVMYEFYSLAFRNKAVQQALRVYLQSYLGGLVPLIQQGIDSGEFRRVDPRETAVTIGAIIEGTLLLWVFDPRLVDSEKQIVSGMQLVLAGLKASMQ